MSGRTNLFDISSLLVIYHAIASGKYFQHKKDLHSVSLRESILALASSPSRIAFDRAIRAAGLVSPQGPARRCSEPDPRPRRRGTGRCGSRHRSGDRASSSPGRPSVPNQTPRPHTARCRAPVSNTLADSVR